MKKLLSIIILAVVASCASTLFAEGTVLTVNLKDGTKEHYKLSETPSVTVTDHQMQITSTAVQHAYNFDDVSHFIFEDEKVLESVDKIDEISDFTFIYTDNATVIISAPELKSASVYTLAGVHALTGAAVDNTVTLDITSLAPGVYVVAPSCHPAIKIIKK